MAAFVIFVRAYAVWIYLFLILGILFGVKMLVDAQRLSRATLFSLDQERATQRTYSALLLMAVFLIGMFVVTGIVVLVAPLAPTLESPILRSPTSTIVALIFPTNTRTPTATATVPAATETPFVTTTPILATPTRPTIKPTLPPALLATATPLYGLPAPIIIGPLPNGVVLTGEERARNDLKFEWKWNCDQCRLGFDDRFIVTVSFADKASGATRFIGGGTQANFLTMADIIRGSGMEVWHQAKEDAFQWNVQVKRGDLPLTAPSDTWKFVWH